MTFRFQARYVLLTYPQCGDLDPFRIVNLLSELGGECIIGRENHEDGGTHLHAFCDFEKKFRSRNARIFDIDSHHPNIQKCIRTPGKMWDYATKDGDICAGGLERPSEKTDTKNDLIALILSETSREQLLERARELDPGFFVRYYFQLRAIGETLAERKPSDYHTPEGVEFNVSGYKEISDWLSNDYGRRGGR